MIVSPRGAAIAAGGALLIVLTATGRLTPTHAAGAEPAPFPRATPRDVGLSEAPLQEASALLGRAVAGHQIAGAVAAVARRGKLVATTAVGVQDVTTGAPMTDASIFRIYSMTKAVTAVAVLMLRDEGHFRLDDPVSRFLPEFAGVTVFEGPLGSATRRPSRPITVEDLLLHTSGLSHRTSDLYQSAGVRRRDITLSRFISNIVRVPLMEDPGTRFRYSEATTVLGRLVEVWSGQPFDAFLRSRIFEPLGMADTGFWVDGSRRARLVAVHRPSARGELEPFDIEAVPFTGRPALLEGAVGLVSTAPDFLRFCQMLLNRGTFNGARILAAGTVDRMTVNSLSPRVLAARGGATGWGLANVDVVISPDPRGYLMAEGEYGWDGSAGTMFAVDPAHELITVLLMQQVPADAGGLRRAFASLVHEAVMP